MKTATMLSYVMIGLLLIVAILCFTMKGAEQWLPGNRKYIMGIVLMTYSLIRFLRLRRTIKMSTNEE